MVQGCISRRPVDIRLIDDSSRLSNLHDEWNALLERSPAATVFLTHEWLCTWWDVFGGGKQLAVLLARDGGRLVGIAPLYLERRRVCGVFPLRQLRFLASRVTPADYLGFVIEQGRETEVAVAFAEFLLESLRWDLMLLTDMPEQAGPLEHLCAWADGRRMVSSTRPKHRCPYVSLPDRWDAFMEQPDRHYKHVIRGRELRKLTRQHQTRAELCVSGRRIDPALDTLMRLHTERWNSDGLPGQFATESQREFYRKVAHALAKQGWLRLSELDVDGETVAMLLGAEYGGEYYMIQTACGRKGRDLRAGNVILYRAFESLVGHVRGFHMLRGAEPYKYKWGGVDRRTVDLFLWRGAKGRLCHQVQKVVARLSTPPRVRNSSP